MSGGRAAAVDRWLVAVLLLAVCLFCVNMSWGLPNGNSSWAADAIGPVTSLGIVYRSFSEWNSGWYYFKYPLGWPFLLFLATAPYLAWLYVTGRWSSPQIEYPHGFADPEATLYTMAMIGRCLNVLFGLGIVIVSYGIANRLLGRRPARLAAFFVATAYPIIYYTHTSNLDASYLFWLLLAVYAAIVAARSERLLPWLTLGAAAAMAVSSKEQGFALLLPLPFMTLAPSVRALGWRGLIARNNLAMAAAAIVTAAAANNVFYNPLGFVARIAYLLGRPLEPVSVRLAPVEFALWKGAKEWVYVRQLWDGVESTLGTPLVLLAVLGVAVAVVRYRRAALWLLAPALAHYYLSLRGLDLITLRYLLPISVFLAIFAALALVEMRRWLPARLQSVALVAIGVVCLLGLARAIDLHRTFFYDPRYAAERWIEANGKAGNQIEYYQKKTFLPRLRGRVRGRFVKMEDRSLAGLRERSSWGVVLSSASNKSIANEWNPDWRETRNLLRPVAPARELLEAIVVGETEYRKVAEFRLEPKLLRSRITSLAPEISIYARD